MMVDASSFGVQDKATTRCRQVMAERTPNAMSRSLFFHWRPLWFMRMTR